MQKSSIGSKSCTKWLRGAISVGTPNYVTLFKIVSTWWSVGCRSAGGRRRQAGGGRSGLELLDRPPFGPVNTASRLSALGYRLFAANGKRSQYDPRASPGRLSHSRSAHVARVARSSLDSRPTDLTFLPLHAIKSMPLIFVSCLNHGTNVTFKYHGKHLWNNLYKCYIHVTFSVSLTFV